MSDKKISQLSASTTPLAGTEVLPIVQSGATKKVSVADLTAGRPISATEITLTTGNVIIGTAGKGIDFSVTGDAADMASELLDDYEEGTFTPTIFGSSTAGTTTYTSQVGRYTKIGNRVFYSISVGWSAQDGSGNLRVGGLPFTSANVTGSNFQTVAASNLTFSGQLTAEVANNGTTIIPYGFASAGAISSVSLDTAATIWISGHYQAA
jgi:hypothetical protein